MLSRVACGRNGGDELLKVHLRRITESGLNDVPQADLAQVIDASYDAECRQEIMSHLRECLSEPIGKRWQRIYGGLVLVDKLVQGGSPALLIEVAVGFHFDLIQKVSFLEQFDASARGCTDARAQGLVRQRAQELRATLVPLLQSARTEGFGQSPNFVLKDTLSSGGNSTSTGSTRASSSVQSTPTLGTLNDQQPSSIKQPKSAAAGARRFKWLRFYSFGAKTGLPAVPDASHTSAVDGLAARAKLATELQRITDSGTREIPVDWFVPIVSASYESDGLQVIFAHLRGCLECNQWRRVYAGLCVFENLLHRGSPQVFEELSHGAGYGVARAVWLSQQFDDRRDWRAQSLVRKRARALQEELAQWSSRSLDMDSDVEAPQEVVWDSAMFHMAQDLAHHHAVGAAEGHRAPAPGGFDALREWADGACASVCSSPARSELSRQSSRISDSASSSEIAALRESSSPKTPSACCTAVDSIDSNGKSVACPPVRERSLSFAMSDDSSAIDAFFTPMQSSAAPIVPELDLNVSQARRGSVYSL
mmetsp:Transcript_33337/g.91969  ORF Transcript_33337/g.91969 Transcript_33337/m.91969 type:complete len:536 (-) Transcript_33337:179-1786(-)